MSDDEKVAGRLPAVKAGGMRIVQHKNPSTERAGKDPVEVIGLSNPTPNVQSEVALGTSPDLRSHSVEASQAAHQHKPEKPINHKPVNHINQPRKQQ